MPLSADGWLLEFDQAKVSTAERRCSKRAEVGTVEIVSSRQQLRFLMRASENALEQVAAGFAGIGGDAALARRLREWLPNYAWNDAGAPGSDRRSVVGRRDDGHRMTLHLQKTFRRTNGIPNNEA
jgi:hypothetical protein